MFKNKKLDSHIAWVKAEISFLHDERWRLKKELWKLQADVQMICKHFDLVIEDISERRLTDVRAVKNQPEQRKVSVPTTPQNTSEAGE
jgi:hypothetical protein